MLFFLLLLVCTMGHSELSTARKGRLHLRLLNLIAYVVALLPGLILVAHPQLLVVPLLGQDAMALEDLPLFLAFVSNLAGTLVIFGFSLLCRNSSMFDPYWSVVPPVYFLYFVLVSRHLVLGRAILVGFVVNLWALRLTVNCFNRWDGIHQEDWRYSHFRKYGLLAYWIISLAGFHLFPSLLVFVGSVSIYVSVVLGTSSLGWLDLVALVASLVAIGFEFTADTQMDTYVGLRQAGKVKDDILRVGVWGISRCVVVSLFSPSIPLKLTFPFSPHFQASQLLWGGFVLGFSVSIRPRQRGELDGYGLVAAGRRGSVTYVLPVFLCIDPAHGAPEPREEKRLRGVRQEDSIPGAIFVLKLSKKELVAQQKRKKTRWLSSSQTGCLPASPVQGRPSLTCASGPATCYGETKPPSWRGCPTSCAQILVSCGAWKL